MSLPKPQVGLGISYAYLWAREHGKGNEEGLKDRPCAIMAARQVIEGREVVTVVPITHSPPSHSADAIEVPPALENGIHYLSNAPSCSGDVNLTFEAGRVSVIPHSSSHKVGAKAWSLYGVITWTDAPTSWQSQTLRRQITTPVDLHNGDTATALLICILHRRTAPTWTCYLTGYDVIAR